MTEAHPENQRARERRAVVIAIAAVAGLYATLAVLRLTRFDLTAFDAGIFDNVLWRLANGYSDITDLTGSHHFSDHMSLTILLAVPIYAITPALGLPILMVAQVASVALVSLAAWLLADHLKLDSDTKRAVLIATLLGAGSFNAALIDIHEVGLAVGPLALTAVLGLRGTRLRRYWIWPVLAAAARIDIAVSVLIIGLLLRKDQPRHGRFVITVGGSFAATMLVWLLVNPWDGTSFGFHFAHLNIDSASQLPGAMLADPIAALKPLGEPRMWGTIAIWLLSFTALAPLRAARWILPALPTIIIPVLGSWSQADQPHLHYWHVLLPMLAVAMVLGLARTPELRKKAFLLAVAGAGLSWILMPVFKPSFGEDLSDERAVVAYLQQSPDASLTVINNLIPHVSQRPSVMQLPTPFACPTEPIASFRGPDHPPDLVAVPTLLLERPGTPAAIAVGDALDRYYEQVQVFGDLEVWQLVDSMPPEIYEAVCVATDSENS